MPNHNQLLPSLTFSAERNCPCAAQMYLFLWPWSFFAKAGLLSVNSLSLHILCSKKNKSCNEKRSLWHWQFFFFFVVVVMIFFNIYCFSECFRVEVSVYVLFVFLSKEDLVTGKRPSPVTTNLAVAWLASAYTGDIAKQDAFFIH